MKLITHNIMAVCYFNTSLIFVAENTFHAKNTLAYFVVGSVKNKKVLVL